MKNEMPLSHAFLDQFRSQRSAIQAINKKFQNVDEKLYGLSRGALSRWKKVNGMGESEMKVVAKILAVFSLPR